MRKPILEPAAQAFADAAARPPFLYELGPAGARKALHDIQAAPIDKLDVDEPHRYGRASTTSPGCQKRS
jgi:acetyl esterase